MKVFHCDTTIVIVTYGLLQTDGKVNPFLINSMYRLDEMLSQKSCHAIVITQIDMASDEKKITKEVIPTFSNNIQRELKKLSENPDWIPINAY